MKNREVNRTVNVAGRTELLNRLSGLLRKRHLSKDLKEAGELARQIFRGRVFQAEERTNTKAYDGRVPRMFMELCGGHITGTMGVAKESCKRQSQRDSTRKGGPSVPLNRLWPLF